MTLIFYKILSALLIFLVSVLTVIHPLKKKITLKHTESAHLGDALASGIFLGAAFFHMLPDSVRLFEKAYGTLSYPIPEMICVLGFLLLLLLERLSLTYSPKSKNSIPYLLAIILIIHAIVEGAALGVGVTLAETIMLLIAILAHKGSESFALCMTMLRHQFPFSRVLFIIIIFALMTPLGIFLGAAINVYTVVKNGEWLPAAFNAFAAGTFLYISTLHHVHFHEHAGEDSQGLLEFGCLVLGTSIMAAIAWWA